MLNKIKIRKKVCKSGNGYVLYLDNTIIQGFELKEGDLVDISDMYKVLENIKQLPKNQTMKEVKEHVRLNK